jgi:predicted DNA-binding transcriptional regulator YafY
MNRTDRLLAMLSVLQSRQIITVDQLAKHFRISTGKVYNDIVALQKLNILVQFNADSGCLSLKGRLIPVVNFTKEEGDALVKRAADTGPAIHKGHAPLERALKKIADVLKEQQHSKAYLVYSQDKLIIPASIKSDRNGFPFTVQ